MAASLHSFPSPPHGPSWLLRLVEPLEGRREKGSRPQGYFQSCMIVKKVKHESCTIIFRWPLGLKFHKIMLHASRMLFWIHSRCESQACHRSQKSSLFKVAPKLCLVEKMAGNEHFSLDFCCPQMDFSRGLRRIMSAVTMEQERLSEVHPVEWLTATCSTRRRVCAGVVHHPRCGGTLSSHAGSRLPQWWRGDGCLAMSHEAMGIRTGHLGIFWKIGKSIPFGFRQVDLPVLEVETWIFPAGWPQWCTQCLLAKIGWEICRWMGIFQLSDQNSGYS